MAWLRICVVLAIGMLAGCASVEVSNKGFSVNLSATNWTAKIFDTLDRQLRP